MAHESAQKFEKFELFFFFAIAALVILRLLAVAFTPLNLGPDEAQYWRWAQNFDWGYFSKPPFIAWIIACTTSLFGDQEWAVRVASPLFHAGSALMLYLCGRLIWSPAVGVLAGLCWMFMGGIWLSSTIMSTDVPLLFFWSVGLYCFLRLRDGGGLAPAIGLGLALALGFLSKYAMIYFVISLVLAVLIDKPSRKALISRNGLLAALLFGALFLPHILWNIDNGFKTVSHTADNARWNAELLNPENGFKFIGDQLGVFSPVHFIMLIVLGVLALLGRSRFLREDYTARLLFVFILPPLLIIIVQAFISRAHANWAATAYPAACVLLGAWAVTDKGWTRRSMIAGLILMLPVGLIYTTLISLPLETQIAMGVSNASKRLRGWPETVRETDAVVRANAATSVLVDEREIWHGLDYYGRDGELSVPVLAWREFDHAASASEETEITDETARNVLLLSYRPSRLDMLLDDFRSHELIGEMDIDLGGGKNRRFDLYLLQGFKPAPRNGSGDN